MKNIALFLLIIVCLPLFAQEENLQDDYLFNSAGLTYKGILDTIADKSKSFEQKYSAVGLIDYIEPLEKTTDVFQKILLQAKQQVEKKYTLSLYSAVANNYLFASNTDNAKLYLDSALTYVAKVDDLGTLGLFYFIRGRYFDAIADESEMVNSYYKSISYFEQVEDRKVTAMMLLYSIGALYAEHQDISSLKKIVDKSLRLASKINEATSYINAYSLAGGYYEIKWKESNTAIDYDSVIFYQKKIIDVYNNADNVSKGIAIALVSQCYLNLAEIMILHYDNSETAITNDWSEIKNYIKNANYIMQDKKSIYSKYDSVRCHYLNAKILANDKIYDKARQSALNCISLIDEQPYDKNIYKEYRHKTYSILAKMEEEVGNSKSALHYLKLAYPLAIALQNEKKYKEVKELEIQYETAKKDLLISQQKEREQQIMYNRTLMIAGFIVIAVFLLFAVFYNRLKRLRKEKEATGLAKRIEQKDSEYQLLLNDTELKNMQHYLEGLEAERTRLAKELHDNVANKLYHLDQELRKVEYLPSGVSPQLEDLYSNIRNISHELIPPVFKYASLAEVLENYVFVLSEKVETTFSLNIENEENVKLLSPELSLEIYRIVQESIGNILKHAKAKNAWITLSVNDKQIMLTIEDDGQGFEIKPQQRGIGLQIIKSRCESLQGELQILSEMGAGTKVQASFPFSRDQSIPV